MPGASVPPRYTRQVRIHSMAVHSPAPVARLGDELAVSVVFLTATKRSQNLVIGVAYLSDGVLKGYQVAGRTMTQAIRPTLMIVAYLVATAEGSLPFRGPRIALAAAVLLYIPAKFFLLPPGLLSFPPFSDQLSPAWANVLVIGLPVAILCAAPGGMVLYVKHAKAPSLLAAYLVFGTTDAFLTIALYAPMPLE